MPGETTRNTEKPADIDSLAPTSSSSRPGVSTREAIASEAREIHNACVSQDIRISESGA